eukprot:6365461-Prymnesium_polylepis.1
MLLASSIKKGDLQVRANGRTTVTFPTAAVSTCCITLNASSRPSLTMCALNAASIAVDAGHMAVLEPSYYTLTAVAAKGLEITSAGC